MPRPTPFSEGAVILKLSDLGEVPCSQEPGCSQRVWQLILWATVKREKPARISSSIRNNNTVHTIMECVPSSSVETSLKKLRPILPAEEKRRDQGADVIGRNKYCAYTKCNEDGEFYGQFYLCCLSQFDFEVYDDGVSHAKPFVVRAQPKPCPCNASLNITLTYTHRTTCSCRAYACEKRVRPQPFIVYTGCINGISVQNSIVIPPFPLLACAVCLCIESNRTEIGSFMVLFKAIYEIILLWYV